MPNEELKGTLLKEMQNWGETRILQIEDEEYQTKRVKVRIDEGEKAPQNGTCYRFHGAWQKHLKYGWQFIAGSYSECEPFGKAGTINYIRKAPFMSRARAEGLWNAFGKNALTELKKSPLDCAKQLKWRNFSEAQAKELKEELEKQSRIESTMIKVHEVLGNHGFPKKTAKVAVQLWKDKAVEFIKRNPYILTQLPGIGFLKADALYLAMGKDEHAVKRQTLAILYGFQNNSDGHTWFDLKRIKKICKDTLRFIPDLFPPLKLGIQAKVFSRKRTGTEEKDLFLTSAKRCEQEESIAESAQNLNKTSGDWSIPDFTSDLPEVSEHQKSEMAKCLSSRIGLFGGSPGCGKSFSAARLIKKLQTICDRKEIAIAAPTAKAAVRITEALNDVGLDYTATTIHKLLGVRDYREGEFIFNHHDTKPLPHKFVIIDESSMIDTALMSSLLKAIDKEDGHLLLIGDVHQLSPVGHGAPLRDLLEVGIPQGELTEIRRNSGAIVETCSKIRNGEEFELERSLDLPLGNLCLENMTKENPEHSVLETLDWIAHQGDDRVWDAQILTACNFKSNYSREHMNIQLQSALNKHNQTNDIFWKNDKVICTKNKYLPASNQDFDVEFSDNLCDFKIKDNGDVEILVANGEIGRVLHVERTKMIVKFFNPDREILIPRGPKGQVDGLDLAYAISCHKSQGSEFPYVIVILDPTYSAKMICDKNWIYTAISRAKKACFLKGKLGTAKDMAYRSKITERKTLLVEEMVGGLT